MLDRFAPVLSQMSVKRLLAVIAFQAGRADLDQLVRLQRAVDLRNHFFGKAFIADQDDRLELVRLALQRLALLRIHHECIGEFQCQNEILLPKDFHPVLRRWWESRFAEPTAAQLEGWRAIRGGEER